MTCQKYFKIKKDMAQENLRISTTMHAYTENLN